MHDVTVPWGPPVPHAYFPSGDHDASPPAYHRPPFAPPQVGNLHGRPQPQADAVSQRLKEEQRRRQHEYSHALAEQVRQRDQQKQYEKEQRRREDSAYDPQIRGNHGIVAAAGADRGLFDGLGQNNPAHRTNFGRGRREPALPANASVGQGLNPPVGLQQQQQPYPHVPSMETQYPPPSHQQVGWSGHAEALGLVEPPHHYGEASHGGHPNASWNQQMHQQPRPASSHVQPQQPQQGGRRLRTDLHNTDGPGGSVGDATKQLRLQQQLDMQESLRRQIEDKQRQKLDEKRKREDDERREMEKFEQEKRRQHEEQERLKDEKRRKAQADEEHFRVQQQQLAAANAAAQEQRYHRFHQSPAKTEVVAAQHHQGQPPGMAKKNPFANSRAHLFQDPPSPQQQVHHAPRSQFVPSLEYHQPTSHAQEVFHDQRDHQASVPFSHAVAPLDTRFLLDQYEQVRAELERQRQLVEQLHAQMQLQQQQQQQRQQQQHHHQHQQRQSRDESPRGLPTISDLELLRQELREELEQREASHREELDELRRQQQQHPSRPLDRSTSKQQQEHSPQRQNTSRTLEHSLNKQQQQNSTPKIRKHLFAPPHRGPGRRHDAFVQDALQDDDEKTNGDLEESIGTKDIGGNQQLSPSASHQRQRGHSLRGSSSAVSLQCESKLVFFDGRVQSHSYVPPPPTTHSQSFVKTRVIHEEPEQSQLADSFDQLIYNRGPSPAQTTKPTRRQIGKRCETVNQSADRSYHATVENEGDGDDALGFFVRRIDRNDLEPERYQSGTQPPSSQSQPSLEYHDGLNDNAVATILEDIDDDDHGDDITIDSFDGETLEAIFQRNVRRHEILTGFEAQNQHRPPEPRHWEELHRQLQGVPHIDAHIISTKRTEPSLAASSRWMPSTQMY